MAAGPPQSQMLYKKLENKEKAENNDIFDVMSMNLFNIKDESP